MTKQEIILKISETMAQHLGHSNLISQKDGDQGDTAQRMGTFYSLLILCDDKDASEVLERIWGYDHLKLPSADETYNNLLKEKWGVFRRNNNPEHYLYDYRCLSRDQLSILKLGMAVLGMRWRLFQTLIRQLSRLTFHQNYCHDKNKNHAYKIPDFITPGEITVYLRGLFGWLSIIPNHILDLFLLVDYMLIHFKISNMWDIDNMFSQQLLYAHQKYPTIWSKLVMKWYLKTDFMDRLYNYHKNSDGNNGCEVLYWMYRLAFYDLRTK